MERHSQGETEREGAIERYGEGRDSEREREGGRKVERRRVRRFTTSPGLRSLGQFASTVTQ